MIGIEGGKMPLSRFLGFLQIDCAVRIGVQSPHCCLSGTGRSCGLRHPRRCQREPSADAYKCNPNADLRGFCHGLQLQLMLPIPLIQPDLSLTPFFMIRNPTSQHPITGRYDRGKRRYPNLCLEQTMAPLASPLQQAQAFTDALGCSENRNTMFLFNARDVRPGEATDLFNRETAISVLEYVLNKTFNSACAFAHVFKCFHS